MIANNMANFLVRATNSVFTVDTNLEGVDDAREASSVGIRGASQMVADEIANGATAASVLLSVHDAADAAVSRYVITMSVSQLKP